MIDGRRRGLLRRVVFAFLPPFTVWFNLTAIPAMMLAHGNSAKRPAVASARGALRARNGHAVPPPCGSPQLEPPRTLFGPQARARLVTKRVVFTVNGFAAAGPIAIDIEPRTVRCRWVGLPGCLWSGAPPSPCARRPARRAAKSGERGDGDWGQPGRPPPPTGTRPPRSIGRSRVTPASADEAGARDR